ncbi:MAG TPA: GxxExxY protein [Candidatus Didemnitutus sp.]|nr:GxxExxY protein [Candidatus Didemnitutus sp.]
MTTLSINDLSHAAIGAAIEVHRELGPGLLESAYEGAYCHELELRGLSYVRQQTFPITYKGAKIDAGYRLDLVVDDRLLIELKAVEKLAPVHASQLLTYLRLRRNELGLLINFNVQKLVDGIERISNRAPNLSANSASSALKN